MAKEIYVIDFKIDGRDGLIVRFSEGTSDAYTVEELLELRPHREPVRPPPIALKASISRPMDSQRESGAPTERAPGLIRGSLSFVQRVSEESCYLGSKLAWRFGQLKSPAEVRGSGGIRQCRQSRTGSGTRQ